MAADGTLTDTAAAPPEFDLVARIERAVRCRTGGRIRHLRVELQGDGVILSGVAETYYAKQSATHAALAELAELTLTNDIDVV